MRKSTILEIEKHNKIIDGVINARDSKELKAVLDMFNDYDWVDKTREMFLLGLLQGALMQFNKEVCVEELNTIFKFK